MKHRIRTSFSLWFPASAPGTRLVFLLWTVRSVLALFWLFIVTQACYSCPLRPDALLIHCSTTRDLLQQVRQCWWVIPPLPSRTEVSITDICTWHEVSLPLAGSSRRQAYFYINMFTLYNGLIPSVWYSPTFIRSPEDSSVSKKTANDLTAALPSCQMNSCIIYPLKMAMSYFSSQRITF